MNKECTHHWSQPNRYGCMICISCEKYAYLETSVKAKNCKRLEKLINGKLYRLENNLELAKKALKRISNLSPLLLLTNPPKDFAKSEAEYILEELEKTSN